MRLQDGECLATKAIPAHGDMWRNGNTGPGGMPEGGTPEGGMSEGGMPEGGMPEGVTKTTLSV